MQAAYQVVAVADAGAPRQQPRAKKKAKTATYIPGCDVNHWMKLDATKVCARNPVYLDAGIGGL
jgi:hypothetical protein